LKVSVKALALGLVLVSGAAFAQQAPAPNVSVPVQPGATAPELPPPGPVADDAQMPVQPQGGTVLTLRGLDKITGRPTNITAPIGKTVRFATLSITARYCYSTPPSEPPETAAFVQITDQRPEQGVKAVFSGWMYASSPGLNGMEHPLYDVWAIGCNNVATPGSPAVTASTAPVKVKAPDSSDKEQEEELPAEAGR
jgi:hypothetical protein